MALRQLVTDPLKFKYNSRDLEFGNDRPGGGSSKHPFVIKDLPAVDSAPTDTFPDFILRDPKNQLENRKDDLTRISKFLKSREGGLFIAKQELLSLQNPLTPGRPNRSNPVAGLYNPLMTLAQVAGAGTGLHIEKQGLFPIIDKEDKYNYEYRKLSLNSNNNRLSLLYTSKISGSLNATQTFNSLKYGIALSNDYILSYTGGPDSYGIGRTRIPFSKDRLTTKELEDRTNEAKGTSQNNVLLSTANKSIRPLLGVSKPENLKSVDIEYKDSGSAIYLNTLSINNKGEYINFNQASNYYPALLRNNIADSGSAFKTATNKVLLSTANRSIKPLLGVSKPEYLKSVDTKYENSGSAIYLNTLSINNRGEYINFNQASNYYPALLRNKVADPEINAALSQSRNRTALPLTADDYISNLTKVGVSQKSTDLKYITIDTGNTGNGFEYNNTNFLLKGNSVYTLGNTFPEQNPANTTDLGVYTLNQTQISSSTSLGPLFLSNPSDFRSEIIRTNLDSGLYSFDYQSHTIDIKYRIGMGNPGNRIRKRDREALATSSDTGSLSSNSVWSTVDKVNYQKLYVQKDGESLIINNISAKADDNTGRDLVTFYFSVIDNDDPTNATYVHFRAFIGNVRDNYDAEYNTTKYIGRGEKFYNYSGFDRQITIDFKVAPQTALEMRPLHQKLNYLASLTAPDYSTGKGNFMRSNVTKLWLGEYFYGIPGFIKNVSYDITEDSTWEINFDQPEGGVAGGKGNLLTGPRLWTVSITFVPIHNFAPRLVDIEDQRKTAFFTPDSTYSNKINPYLPGVTGSIA
jgi:hypothetical protein